MVLGFRLSRLGQSLESLPIEIFLLLCDCLGDLGLGRFHGIVQRLLVTLPEEVLDGLDVRADNVLRLLCDLVMVTGDHLGNASSALTLLFSRGSMVIETALGRFLCRLGQFLGEFVTLFLRHDLLDMHRFTFHHGLHARLGLKGLNVRRQLILAVFLLLALGLGGVRLLLGLKFLRLDLHHLSNPLYQLPVLRSTANLLYRNFRLLYLL